MLSQIVKQTSTQMTAVGRRGIARSAARTAGDHGGHHQHYVFEGEFSRTAVNTLTFVVVGLGVAIPVGLVTYQNVKHGFPRDE